MTDIVAPSFVEPKPQAVLGGEIGVTSREIADVLQARHDKVKESIEKICEVDPDFTLNREIDSREGPGRRESRYVLNIEDAKLVVAQYKSKVGIAYARYLVAFERRAREQAPQLQAAFEAMRQKCESLQARLDATAKPKALPTPKTQLITEVITKHDSIMGDGEVIERHLVRVPREGLTELDVKKAKRVMLILQQRGIATAIERLSNEIDFAEQAPAQRLKLAKKV